MQIRSTCRKRTRRSSRGALFLSCSSSTTTTASASVHPRCVAAAAAAERGLLHADADASDHCWHNCNTPCRGPVHFGGRERKRFESSSCLQFCRYFCFSSVLYLPIGGWGGEGRKTISPQAENFCSTAPPPPLPARFCNFASFCPF